MIGAVGGAGGPAAAPAPPASTAGEVDRAAQDFSGQLDRLMEDHKTAQSGEPARKDESDKDKAEGSATDSDADQQALLQLLDGLGVLGAPPAAAAAPPAAVESAPALASTAGEAPATPAAAASAPVRGGATAPAVSPAAAATGPQPDAPVALPTVPKVAAGAQQDLPISAASTPAPSATSNPIPLPAWAAASASPLSALPPSMPSPAAGVPIDLRDGGWQQAIASRILWSLGEGLQQATLELHPQELGRVDVQISVVGSNVELAFQAGDAGARAALQSALPHLRSAFAVDGMQLAQTRIATTPTARSGTDASRRDLPPTRRVVLRRAGLVDDYV